MVGVVGRCAGYDPVPHRPFSQLCQHCAAGPKRRPAVVKSMQQGCPNAGNTSGFYVPHMLSCICAPPPSRGGAGVQRAAEEGACWGGRRRRSAPLALAVSCLGLASGSCHLQCAGLTPKVHKVRS